MGARGQVPLLAVRQELQGGLRRPRLTRRSERTKQPIGDSWALRRRAKQRIGASWAIGSAETCIWRRWIHRRELETCIRRHLVARDARPGSDVPWLGSASDPTTRCALGA